MVPADQRELVHQILDFQLGGSKQQKLISHCKELVRREQTTVAQLINQWNEDKGTTSDGRENKPQEAQSLLTWLQRRAAPRSAEAEDAFKHFASSLQLPSNCRLEHTPSFEDDSITLQITLKDQIQCKRLITLLRSHLEA
jgi:hypothetical protein